MYAAFNKYSPGLVSSQNFDDAVVGEYVAGELFGAAAKAGDLGSGGTATSAQVLNGLYSLKGTTLGGLAPPLSFRKGQPADVDCYFQVRILHHQWATPEGLRPVCLS